MVAEIFNAIQAREREYGRSRRSVNLGASGRQAYRTASVSERVLERMKAEG
jgi:hypothetical protein